MSFQNEIVDLTAELQPAKKQKLSDVPSAQPLPSSNTSSKLPTVPKTAKVGKKDLPHVLIWVCAAGKGQGRSWSQKSLKIVGVYASKEEAEKKKDSIMQQYPQCGHGDIIVGDTWQDEIDLVIRPAGECTL